MSHPPHLPQKSCSVTLHNLFHNIRNIVFFVCLSVFAGITGALIVIAWIEPTFYGSESVFFVNRDVDNQFVSQEFPDPHITQRVNYGTMRLYDKTQALGETSFYPPQAFLGRAAMLSSDGWAVAYMPHKSSVSTIEVLDYQGTMYEIDEMIIDPYTDFVYFKFNGTDFHVMSFGDWDAVVSGEELWSVDNDGIHKRMIGQSQNIDMSVYNALIPYTQYEVVPALSEESLVVNTQGQFVGFVDKQNVLELGWSVSHHVGALLSQDDINNPSFSLLGYIVENNQIGQMNDAESTGFFVTSANGTDELLAGDIILKMNGVMLRRDMLYQQIYQAGDPVTALVLRNGVKVDILMIE